MVLNKLRFRPGGLEGVHAGKKCYNYKTKQNNKKETILVFNYIKGPNV